MTLNQPSEVPVGLLWEDMGAIRIIKVIRVHRRCTYCNSHSIVSVTATEMAMGTGSMGGATTSMAWRGELILVNIVVVPISYRMLISSVFMDYMHLDHTSVTMIRRWRCLY